MPELVMTGYKTEDYETAPDYNDEVGDKQTVGAINEIEGILKRRGILLSDISENRQNGA